ncbi:uncharacterized protein RJT20DRAFT_124304 [Scheffersomyces xylosifermentans]|uniref:uncharacterized protein n=1 Tax=Scheffersomyces xylosifermentans TaxID=1304137 RepID=UPI00315DB63E
MSEKSTYNSGSSAKANEAQHYRQSHHNNYQDPAPPPPYSEQAHGGNGPPPGPPPQQHQQNTQPEYNQFNQQGYSNKPQGYSDSPQGYSDYQGYPPQGLPQNNSQQQGWTSSGGWLQNSQQGYSPLPPQGPQGYGQYGQGYADQNYPQQGSSQAYDNPNVYKVKPNIVNMTLASPDQLHPSYQQYLKRDEERIQQGNIPLGRENFKHGAPLEPGRVSTKTKTGGKTFPGRSGATYNDAANR